MDKSLMCFTTVEWREIGDDDTSTPLSPPNLTCPSEGEVRWANLETGGMFPDDALKIGQKRWMLYVPSHAFANGFYQEGNPQELDLCAIVEVELLQVFLPRYSQGTPVTTWTECHCLRTVPLSLIPTIFPLIPIPDKKDTNLLGTFGKTMTYFEEQTPEYQNWYMITNPSATQNALPRLVLSGFSMDSYGFISNWVVEYDKTSCKAA